MKIDCETCIRKRIVINGENYYLIVGKDFVDVTVPQENRPDRVAERMIIDTLCAEITNIMGVF